MADNFNPMQWLADRDSEYAEKVRGLAPKGDGMFESFGKYAADFAGMDSQKPNYGNPVPKAAVGAGVATRYALPAFGVTAAGIALADLAGYFGGSPDQPEQGQLGLNNGELSALGVIAASPAIAGIIGGGMDMFGGGEPITAGSDAPSSYERQVNEAYAQSNNDALVMQEKKDRQARSRGRLGRSSRR